MKKKEHKINVRVIKKPAKSSKELKEVQPKKEVYRKIEKPQPKEIQEKNKKIVVGVSVIIVMVIIFFAWLALLGKNFASIDNSGPSFWQRLTVNLKDEFNEIKNNFERAKASLRGEDNKSRENDLEEDLFPKIKNNLNN